jgi:hypothetical protein
LGVQALTSRTTGKDLVAEAEAEDIFSSDNLIRGLALYIYEKYNWKLRAFNFMARQFDAKKPHSLQTKQNISKDYRDKSQCIYKMLSKMAKIEETPEIPKEYDKMKLNELKPILKGLGLKISGNKSKLVERLQTHKLQVEHAINIQRTFRGYMARLWIRLKKGNKNPCVNEADFYTMEPIDEIPFYYYIHYTEDKSQTNYTFNIMSLCTMISKSGKFENPYTRENMKPTCGSKLAKIIRLTMILFPDNEIITELKDVYVGDKIQVQDARQGARQGTGQGARQGAGQNAMNETRQLVRQEPPTIDRRITELFIAIDTLGHYTQKEWFLQLSNTQICTLVMRINSLWVTTTPDVRRNISPNVSPFSVQNTGVTRMSLDRTLDENRLIAVKVGESLIYNGINNDYKIMGVMFFLTGLTTVSYAARLQMPWLYDNYNFVVARL